MPPSPAVVPNETTCRGPLFLVLRVFRCCSPFFWKSIPSSILSHHSRHDPYKHTQRSTTVAQKNKESCCFAFALVPSKCPPKNRNAGTASKEQPTNDHPDIPLKPGGLLLKRCCLMSAICSVDSSSLIANHVCKPPMELVGCAVGPRARAPLARSGGPLADRIQDSQTYPRANKVHQHEGTGGHLGSAVS